MKPLKFQRGGKIHPENSNPNASYDPNSTYFEAHEDERASGAWLNHNNTKFEARKRRSEARLQEHFKKYLEDDISLKEYVPNMVELERQIRSNDWDIIDPEHIRKVNPEEALDHDKYGEREFDMTDTKRMQFGGPSNQLQQNPMDFLPKDYTEEGSQEIPFLAIPANIITLPEEMTVPSLLLAPVNEKGKFTGELRHVRKGMTDVHFPDAAGVMEFNPHARMSHQEFKQMMVQRAQKEDGDNQFMDKTVKELGSAVEEFKKGSTVKLRKWTNKYQGGGGTEAQNAFSENFGQFFNGEMGNIFGNINDQLGKITNDTDDALKFWKDRGDSGTDEELTDQWWKISHNLDVEKMRNNGSFDDSGMMKQLDRKEYNAAYGSDNYDKWQSHRKKTDKYNAHRRDNILAPQAMAGGAALAKGQQGYNDYLKTKEAPIQASNGFFGVQTYQYGGSTYGRSADRNQSGTQSNKSNFLNFRNSLNSGRDLVEIQTEKGEYLASPFGDIVKTAATKLHKHMKDDVVTDLSADGNYVFSRDPAMMLKKGGNIDGIKYDEIHFGYTPTYYQEGIATSAPKKIKFMDMAPKKSKFTPADYIKGIQKKIPVSDRSHDAFASTAITMNKDNRKDYLEVLKVLGEMKKPRGKGIPAFQMGGAMFSGPLRQPTNNAIAGMQFPKDTYLEQMKRMDNNNIYNKNFTKAPTTMGSNMMSGNLMNFKSGGTSTRKQHYQWEAAVAKAVTDIGFGISDRVSAKKNNKKTMRDIKNAERQNRELSNQAMMASAGGAFLNYATQDPSYDYLDLSSSRARVDSTYDRVFSNTQANRDSQLNSARGQAGSMARNLRGMGLSPSQAANSVNSYYGQGMNNANATNQQYGQQLNQLELQKTQALSGNDGIDTNLARDRQFGNNLVTDRFNKLNAGLIGGMVNPMLTNFQAQSDINNFSLAAKMGARNQHANANVESGIRISHGIGNAIDGISSGFNQPDPNAGASYDNGNNNNSNNSNNSNNNNNHDNDSHGVGPWQMGGNTRYQMGGNLNTPMLSNPYLSNSVQSNNPQPSVTQEQLNARFEEIKAAMYEAQQMQYDLQEVNDRRGTGNLYVGKLTPDQA